MPDWVRIADPEAISRASPAAASGLAIQGEATVQCMTSPGGVPTDCTVISETPAGLGFGRASLAAVQFYRFPVQQSDGFKVAGNLVRVPVRFEVPPGDPLNLAKAYQAPARPERQRRLARQVVGLYTPPNWWADRMDAAMAGVPLDAPSGEEARLWADLRTAMAAAIEAGLPRLLDALALEIAAKTPEAVLQRLLAPNPPAEVVAIANQMIRTSSFPTDQPYVLGEVARMRDDARARFCKTRACGG